MRGAEVQPENDELTTAGQINDIIGQLKSVFSRNHAENLTLVQPDRSGRLRAATEPINPLPLTVGMQVKFLSDRRWWTVRATNPACAVLTRTGNFGQGLQYTVIVWAEGRRGPHGSWGHEANTDEGCAKIAEDVAAGTLELSERRAIRLDLEAVR